MLFTIIKNEIAGDKSFDDRRTRWIRVVIDFVLGGLCILAQTRTNVTTERYKVKIRLLTESKFLLEVVEHCNWAKILLSRGALPSNILFAQHVVDEG